MAQLYADENFPLAVVVELQKLGHDVLTAQAAGQANQGIADFQVLAFAVSQGRALLTRNRRHFIRLHKSNPLHHGIIVCTEDHDWPGQAARIHAALWNGLATMHLRTLGNGAIRRDKDRFAEALGNANQGSNDLIKRWRV